jgi:hypothetical protein
MNQENSEEKTEEELVANLINCGAEIAGGAVGAAIGFLAAGPFGAAAFGAVGATVAIGFKKIGEELSGRFLGHREKIRIGAVFALAAVEIKQRLENGEILRYDGYFDKKIFGRSNAEEVLESVLLKSQREPEEKKLPYMAHLLANISFDSSINISFAHQLIKSADQLSYRQLCIINLAVNKETFGLRMTNYRNQGNFKIDLMQVLYECYDLSRKAYINLGGSDVAFGPTDISPGTIKVQGIGAFLYNTMNLVNIPEEDLLPIVEQLK